MKSTIYAPAGLASENCKLALNTMDGCTHSCRYCYVPLVRHIKPEKFHEDTRPRITPGEIEEGVAKFKGEKNTVQLCFSTDPYQDDDVCCGLTRAAIDILHRAGFPVAILTKGGARAQRDLDLFRPGDSFGATMTFLDEEKSRQWEPLAASPEERMANLIEAKMAGIDTYVSLEPVIDPDQSLALVAATAGFTDHYKVGPLNYYKGDLPVPNYDRLKFIMSVIDLVTVKFKRSIHIKKSFSVPGSPDGYRIGVQLP
jgi:DNA repair photolyase